MLRKKTGSFVIIVLLALSLTVMASCTQNNPEAGAETPSPGVSVSPSETPDADSGDAGQDTGAETDPETQAAIAEDEKYFAMLTIDDDNRLMSIGEIGTDESGKTTVEIRSPGLGSVLKIRMDKVYPSCDANIVCGGQTYESTRFSAQGDTLTFTYGTTLTPDKITVFPYGGAEADGVAFDGKTKEVIK